MPGMQGGGEAATRGEPRITEVKIEYGRTVNLGNYESERVYVGLTATVGPDDDALPLSHDLLREAKDTVELHLREFDRQRREEYLEARSRGDG
jgi:hypothetical protein